MQPHINAMTQNRFKDAMDEARRIDDLLASFRSGKAEREFSSDESEMLASPFLGVPISVKESIMIKGMKNSCGLWSRRDVQATYDAEVVKNVKRWGMIPLCTTNIPECTLFWADCQNKVYGRSANPYDLTRITGASSGGEGALIGSGGSVMGIGSDIGGSLRIPAHYCGIFSHKPSPFLVSCEGNFPEVKEYRSRMFTLGPMVRYASDLRPFLKCLLSDKDNAKQDTYYKYQPADIASQRKKVLQKLDEPVDLTQVKFYYFNFNDGQLKGRRAVNVNPEFMEAQEEILNHFRSKFNCQVELIDLEKYMKKVLIIWQSMLRGGGLEDRDQAFCPTELKDVFGIKNIYLETVKMPLGLSKHTKESILTLLVGSVIPEHKSKAYPLCERFEKLGAEFRQEINQILGENGVIIMPTMPTTAYKFNVSLIKTLDIRFSSLANVLQLPATHATLRLDKKHRLPYGFSFATRPFNDAITIAIAEEIELSFGGWIEPTISVDAESSTNHVEKKASTTTAQRQELNSSSSNNQPLPVATAAS